MLEKCIECHGRLSGGHDEVPPGGDLFEESPKYSAIVLGVHFIIIYY
jgi:hypothetical protein